MDSEAPDDQLRKIKKEYQEKKKKREEEERKASDGISMTEAEIRDLIYRTKKAIRLLLALLPKLDATDKRRMDRASEIRN